MVIKLLSMSLYSYSITKSANQNIISIKYFILIGQFLRMSTKIILGSFITARTD